MPHNRIRLVAWISSALAALLLSGGCLERPIAEPVPHTSNTFVDQLAQTSVDKIDLLFVIDNSSSMADKQKFLAQAVPQLLGRLVNPDCVDPNTGKAQLGPGADVACPSGTIKAFRPIADIHIGVISSSLGGHGGEACTEGWSLYNPTQDDHAHLIPSVRASVPDPQGLGFLSWDPGQKATPPGIADVNTLTADFAGAVDAVGEVGCGYEATLESWYRFLVDPEPPAKMVVESNRAHPDGVDQTVLDQRAAFLRPDSLLAVIMLSDENDCSIIDGGSGYLVTTTSKFHMPRATSACAANPNDACCRPCLDETSPPAGCLAVADDPECKKGALSSTDDPPNLRCFEQKRRFGIDLLYSTQRYVDAIKSHTIKDRAGHDVPNPIFTAPATAGVLPRSDDLVFLAGIVGVPWQDIATDESLTNPTELTYLTAEQLEAKSRWDMILGDPQSGVEPADPLMRESVEPRAGNNPVTGAALVDPSSTDPGANPINGHEYHPEAGTDLQYACIFKLPYETDCSTLPASAACDCSGTAEQLAAANSPLCNPPGGGVATSVQHYAKAYPGLRHLEVLRGVGKNGIVASICPKVTDQTLVTDPSYGYTPAVDAILTTFVGALHRCLPRELTPDPTTQRVPCAVIQATLDPACACSGAGYSSDPISGDTRNAVLSHLESSGVCTTHPRLATDLPCDSFCLCGIEQTVDPTAKRACENDPVETIDPNISGYCYIDPDNGVGNPALVGECPSSQKRILRFVGDVPAPRSIVFMACAESSYTDPVRVESVGADSGR